MGDIKDDSIKEILKYKPVKYLVVTILILIIFAGLYSAGNHIYRCHNGLNSRLFWGMDQCSECKIIHVDSITKHDTIYKITTSVPTLFPNHVTTSRHKNPITQRNVVSGDNKGINGNNNNNNHIVSGDHDTIGVNGDVNNYNGVKQRVLTTELLRDIISKIKNPSDAILYKIPQNDKESENYANQIYINLYKRGYLKSDWGFYVTGRPHFDVVYYDYKQLNSNSNDSTFVITVYPASNTNK